MEYGTLRRLAMAAAEVGRDVIAMSENVETGEVVVALASRSEEDYQVRWWSQAHGFYINTGVTTVLAWPEPMPAIAYVGREMTG